MGEKLGEVAYETRENLTLNVPEWVGCTGVESYKTEQSELAITAKKY